MSSRRPTPSRLRPGIGSRNASRVSATYLPDGPADLILPDGPVGEHTAELLHEFIHPHRHEGEDTLVEDDDAGDDDEEREIDAEWEARKALPWWRTPSPYWFLAMIPFSSLTMSAIMAPKIEIMTRIACRTHKPEYTSHTPADAGGVYMPSAVYVPSPDLGSFSPSLNATVPSIGTDGGMEVSIMYTPAERELYKKEQSLCAKDPVVQAAVAKLNTVILASTGILGFISTAWWGALSDRHGRVFVLRFTVLGLLIQLSNFIFVAHYSQYIPGGYWFLVVSAVIEGALGGITTAAAATHAYIADCTPPASRSRLFSLQLGLLFTGTAIGPTLGGLVVRFTQDLLSLFYIALAIDSAYAFMVWCVVPESLTAPEMRRARANHVGDDARRGVLGVFSPLAVFVPAKRGRGKGRDWSLTLVAAAFGLVILNFGGITYKFQYAASQFGWGSEALGYWLSLVGASRAFHLTILLPLIIHLFKPKPPPIQLPTSPSEPLSPGSSTAPPPLAPKAPASPSFDLLLARGSLLVDVLAYTLMPLAPTGGAFTLAAVLGSLGGGFGPAAQSLALELYARQGGRETGRLFGAWSVVQVLASQVLGPAVYGVTYVRTVRTVPQAIFFLSAGGVALSFLLLALIRLPKEDGGGDVEEAEGRRSLGREETLVGDVGEDRGRKAKAKSVVGESEEEV
ncbi:MFS general substrate transporter [Gloeophyllum trabeum ATCC 11539]|uniref:MFS general substrate transporter n=1 Tax=Gloeophyllum trabeum (strain ATCC 11539 / FP-39264 / Madison 617) TaxID=670483 RepID=S7QGI5_GLOTA|nr:MFS general substrate transporter [Gloeophyllum trabeum ATCC 11539]EPQ58298.1 MFS general substrate transporter [Gloeophyllum trabeum ATCC 11539]